MKKKKIIRITTVPISMNKILEGQMAYINNYYDLVGVSQYVEKDFTEIKEREGIKMIAVPFRRTISPFQDIISLLKLIWLFKKEKPDIVHTHTPKAGLLGMIAAKITKVPVRLHTVGGMPLMGVKGTKLKILENTEKLTYRYAHRIFPNSFGLKDFIVQSKFTNEKKIKVLGNGSSNGVDTNFFKNDYAGAEEETRILKQQLGIRTSDFVFVFLGRLAKDKGLIELVSAFNRLSKKDSNLKLLLVGPLEQENSSLPEDTLSVIKNTEAIIYPGRTDNVRGFLRLADVFVFPSYREGFPNALLQAGAMSLPLIATNINGCNEIIENNKTGFLIPSKDEESLCEKMRFLYENSETRIRFGIEIRNNIEKKFKQSIIWDALLKEYNFLLKNKLVR
ncbi:glycosyltransferase family 4 protein [Mesonia ostreae]|uniref:Glycosyltransferase family 4 protein n=1 Tax=Mesonia ostreae TaxID=861110 RepID=A0ABU2KH68_9FLAO|nr:glycosyltransferase family 4 protein [Mesonia ostreae]MDT0294058.1 glycosyltransferase family 4 protein [Mesonia ostreae]